MPPYIRVHAGNDSFSLKSIETNGDSLNYAGSMAHDDYDVGLINFKRERKEMKFF